MDRNEISKKILKLTAEKLSTKKELINEKTSFEDDLNADSIDLTDFTMELENEFNINIPDEDLWKIKTIENAVDYVVEKTV